MSINWDRFRPQGIDRGRGGAESSARPTAGGTRRRGRAVRRAMIAVLASVALVAPLAPNASAQTSSVGTVVIANGWSSADSAVASVRAALEGSGSASAAVLYATSGELTSRTAGFISNYKPAKAILVGGAKALSAAVADEVAGLMGGEAPTRISGSDRFDTAAKAAPSSASTIVVANGYSAADTGVAAALAAVTPNAAVLLATASSLTAPTEEVIADRQPTSVVFVGGTSVLSESLEARVRELAPSVTSVPRHSGRTRSHTAADAAPDTATTVVIANGYSAADSGVAAALAATTGNAAVLYATATSLTAPTAIRISDLQPRAVILVGGTTALGSVMHRSIHCRTPGATISRVSGSDRIDTAVRAASGVMTAIDTSFDCGAGGGGGGGGGGGSAQPVTVPPDTPPTVPPRIVALRVELVGATSVKVQWVKPSEDSRAPITAYHVEYQKETCTEENGVTTCVWVNESDGEGVWEPASTTETATEYTITGLASGTTYRFRVQAVNRIGKGGSSPIGQLTSGAPGMPANVRATPANRQLAVSWATPTVNGSSVTDYDVRHRQCAQNLPNCGGDWANAWEELPDTTNSTATSATIGSLPNLRAQEVQVRAENSQGAGQWSAGVAATPAAPPAGPTAPTGLTVAGDDRQIGARWTAHSDTTVNDYDVRYRSCTNTSDLTCATNPQWGGWTEWNASNTSTLPSATITGLTNGTKYELQVRAANPANGNGAWSASASATPTGKPAAPAAPTVETVSSGSVRVTWTAPNDNGDAITDYDVQYRACTNTSDPTCATNPQWAQNWTDRTGETTGDTGTSVDVTGLANNTAYQVQVRAANGKGESGWSPSGQGRTGVVPAAPAGLKVNDNLADTADENRQLVVKWTASSGAAGYELRYRACTATPRTCASNARYGSWTTHSPRVTAPATTATITGRTNGTKYEVQVRGINTLGGGPWSASASGIPAAAPLSAPSAASLTTEGGEKLLSVSWKAPFDNGAAISQYNIQYCGPIDSEDCSDPKDGTWLTDSSTTTATTITGLTNSKTYRWRVQAQNRIGTGPWSSVTQGSPATVPGAPLIDDLVGNNGSVTVTWTAPEDDGGESINDYDVRYRIADTDLTTPGNQPDQNCQRTDPPVPWCDAGHSGTGTTATISGLTNGVRYDFAVRAGNSVGEGEWSARQDRKAGGAPLAPSRPTVTSGDTELTVSWTAPSNNGGGDITAYKVEYREQDTDETTAGNQPGTWTEDSPSTLTTTHTIVGPTTGSNQGLVNGTVYEVMVRAVNGTGNGAFSPSATGKPAGAPAAPATVRVVGTDQTLTVTWDAPDANGSNVTGFSVRYCTGDTDCDGAGNVLGTIRVTGASARSQTIAGLTNGTSYDVQVATVSSDQGSSAYSETVTETAGGAPSAPTNLSVASGNAQLTASWSAPANDGGWTVASYQIQYCDSSTGCDAASEWTDSSTAETARSHAITGLTNGTTYQVRVRARNTNAVAKGPGPWSSTASGKPATTPSAPTGVKMTSGNRSLTVKWAAPVANGSTVTGFQVRYCEKGRVDTDDNLIDCASYANWSSNVSVSGSSARQTTLSGLTNGAEHMVEVRVVSSGHGNSGWTAWDSLGDQDGSNMPGVPARPSISSVTAGNNQLTVSWTAPSGNGDDINGYELHYCDASVDACTEDQHWRTNSRVTGTPTSHTISGGLVQNGKTYKVRLRASNSRGSSRWSAAVSGTPSA